MISQWPDGRAVGHRVACSRRQSGSVEVATASRSAVTCSIRSLCRRDLRPAQLDQFRRPGDPLGQVVDVDVGTLEFAQDAVEFGEGGGVAGLCGRRRDRLRVRHVDGPSIGVVSRTVLVIEPSTREVVRCRPGATSSIERTTLPSAPRVIDHPRASCTAGSSEADACGERRRGDRMERCSQRERERSVTWTCRGLEPHVCRSARRAGPHRTRRSTRIDNRSSDRSTAAWVRRAMRWANSDSSLVDVPQRR